MNESYLTNSIRGTEVPNSLTNIIVTLPKPQVVIQAKGNAEFTSITS